MHEEEITDYLDLMLESIELVGERFFKVKSPSEFVQSTEGMTLLDAIAIRLQVIGESVKKIQKLDPTFLPSNLNVEWDKIVRFRDLVSHHYNHLDHEIVFDICNVHIPALKNAVQTIRSKLATNDKK